MVVISRKTNLNENNELVMPDDIRQELGLGAGDSVVWTLGNDGVVRIHREVYSFDELMGSLPPLDRPVDDDFGNIIRKSQDEWVAEKMKRYGLK